MLCEVMRIPLSLKLVIATWIAALFGALAGGTLAEMSKAPALRTQAQMAARTDGG